MKRKKVRKKSVDTTSVIEVEILETGTFESPHELDMPSSPTITLSSLTLDP